MPKFNFSKVTKPIEKIEEVTKEVNDTADNKVNSILYDYHVITSKKVDKTKTYYDAFFIALYADEVEDAVKIKRDYTGGYKIYTYNIIPSINKNYNVNCILVEKRDNPKAVIYRIR